MCHRMVHGVAPEDNRHMLSEAHECRTTQCRYKLMRFRVSAEIFINENVESERTVLRSVLASSLRFSDPDPHTVSQPTRAEFFCMRLQTVPTKHDTCGQMRSLRETTRALSLYRIPVFASSAFVFGANPLIGRQ